MIFMDTTSIFSIQLAKKFNRKQHSKQSGQNQYKREQLEKLQELLEFLLCYLKSLRNLSLDHQVLQEVLATLKMKFPNVLKEIHFITAMFIKEKPGNYWKEFTQSIVEFEKSYHSFEVTNLKIEESSKHYKFRIREYMDKDDEVLIYLLAMIDLSQMDNLSSLDYSIEQAKYFIMNIEPKKTTINFENREPQSPIVLGQDSNSQGKDDKSE
ncbi:UNKNOWN [Stylonychia lemnae]|uniref:Uncharacterized protein n=1 Tax=Stylonychia lemnae TaxID=5949 RepID=A0A078AN95_STYLE|nr:UNKNOWN [Stylonychia lemnae]|eukprot:CDW83840.1 UNKNOWN [Stylonychia lemnae]